MVLKNVERKGIGDFHLHPSLTMTAFSSLGDTDQKLIMLNLIGGFQTGSQQSQWSHNHDGACFLCGAFETRKHRLLECASTQDVRDRRQTACDILEQHRPEWQYLPLARQHSNQSLYYLFCDSVVLRPTGTFQETGSQHLKLFTDGGGRHPTMPTCGLATWAIVQGLAVDEAMQRSAADALFLDSPLFPYFRVVQTGFVNHFQAAGRGELSAVVLALAIAHRQELFTTIEFVTDAQYVIDVIHMVECPHFDVFASRLANMDLLTQLKQLWDPRFHSVRKVKSHRPFSSANGSLGHCGKPLCR